MPNLTTNATRMTTRTGCYLTSSSPNTALSKQNSKISWMMSKARMRTFECFYSLKFRDCIGNISLSNNALTKDLMIT